MYPSHIEVVSNLKISFLEMYTVYKYGFILAFLFKFMFYNFIRCPDMVNL